MLTNYCRKFTAHVLSNITLKYGDGTTQIDHIDRKPLNNQRSNLRPATAVQNGHNCGAPSNNTTGVKGVYFDKNAGKYKAQIGFEDKRYHLGLFDTLPEATVVVRKKREELVGEFACH